MQQRFTGSGAAMGGSGSMMPPQFHTQMEQIQKGGVEGTSSHVSTHANNTVHPPRHSSATFSSSCGAGADPMTAFREYQTRSTILAERERGVEARRLAVQELRLAVARLDEENRRRRETLQAESVAYMEKKNAQDQRLQARDQSIRAVQDRLRALEADEQQLEQALLSTEETIEKETKALQERMELEGELVRVREKLQALRKELEEKDCLLIRLEARVSKQMELTQQRHETLDTKLQALQFPQLVYAQHQQWMALLRQSPPPPSSIPQRSAHDRLSADGRHHGNEEAEEEEEHGAALNGRGSDEASLRTVTSRSGGISPPESRMNSSRLHNDHRGSGRTSSTGTANPTLPLGAASKFPVAGREDLVEEEEDAAGAGESEDGDQIDGVNAALVREAIRRQNELLAFAPPPPPHSPPYPKASTNPSRESGAAAPLSLSSSLHLTRVEDPVITSMRTSASQAAQANLHPHRADSSSVPRSSRDESLPLRAAPAAHDNDDDEEEQDNAEEIERSRLSRVSITRPSQDFAATGLGGESILLVGEESMVL